MKYTIEQPGAFEIMASAGEFHAATCATAIPGFWSEYFAAGKGEVACGQFGICLDGRPDGTFRYAIGNACKTEIRADGTTVRHIFNRPDRTEIPAGFELLKIPAYRWLKVECRGALPQAIQAMYPVIEREWPQQYERTGNMNIEEYSPCTSPEDTQKADYLSWIWIPVK